MTGSHPGGCGACTTMTSGRTSNPALAQRTTEEWVNTLGPAGIAVGPVQDVSRWRGIRN